MITLTFRNGDDLSEALYYAHTSAALVLSASPSAALPDTLWEDTDDATRAHWRETARRLIALHLHKE